MTVETPTENALVAQDGIGGKVIDKFKTRLGYNAASSTAASPAVESFVNSSEILENQENNKSKSDKGYHAVPLPYTGNFIPFKPDLTFMDEIVKSENIDVITIVTPSNVKKVESNHESTNVKNNGDVVEPKTIRKNSFRPPIMRIGILMMIPEGYKEKGVIDSGCSRHMTGNKCYLTEYEDYDGGFVSFGGGKGRISRKVMTYRVFVPTKVNYASPKATIDESNLWDKRRLNSVAGRKNKTLIEAARTMLVDSKLPTTFWAKAINTACYVLNKVLVIKPHTKTPYELIHGRTPLIDFMKPFGCPVTILNTRDHLGKFDGKADEGFFVGYSVVSKAIRVFNKRTRIVEETLNIRFLKNTPNVIGNGPDWLFDVDSLTISMNYVPVVAGNQTNGIAGTRDNIVTGHAEKKTKPKQEYILIPICTTDPLISQDPKVREEDAEEKPTEMDENGALDKDGKDDQAIRNDTPVSAAGLSFTNDDPSSPVNVAEASNAFEEHLSGRFSS
ncbi:ribonuclease H-like domain-containing protein [Tanacetum coccineum]